MVLVRGDLPEHAALSQCSHCRNVNNENKAKREKKREREGEGEGAYMLGELRNKVRSVSARRLFPSADSSCAVSPSKLFSSRGTREEKRVRPEKVKSPQKRKSASGIRPQITSPSSMCPIEVQINYSLLRGAETCGAD